MADRCTAKFLWTQKEFVTAMQRHYQLKFRNEFRILMKLTCAFLLLLTLFVIVLQVFSPSPDPAPYGTFLLTAFICGYGLVFDRINILLWKRKFRKRPNVDTDVKWDFADDVIRTETVVGEAAIKWNAFIQIVEFDDGFLFYTMKNFFHWIPLYAFDSSGCMKIVREMAINSKCQYILRK